jgi:hypothetical protein
MKTTTLQVIATVTVILIVALMVRSEFRDHIEVIGEITGRCDDVGLARTNALFETGLSKMHYKWVEVRGGRNGAPFYVVGHTRGHIPKDYVGNAME